MQTYPLCKKVFNNNKALKQHYQNFHNIDPGNYYFWNLFEKTQNTFIPNKCLRCDEFIQTKKYESFHNFLEHYSEDETIGFEDRPIDVKPFGNIKTSGISVKNHAYYNNFQDS